MTIQKVRIRSKTIIRVNCLSWELKNGYPNIYTIKPLYQKGPMHTVNWLQLFNLQRSQGNNLLDQAPDTKLPINLAEKIPERKPPQPSHLYGTRAKSKVYSILLVFFRG